MKDSHKKKYGVCDKLKRAPHKDQASIYCKYEASLPRSIKFISSNGFHARRRSPLPYM
jgi:hypothetical protein